MFTNEREQQYNVNDIVQPPRFQQTSEEIQQVQSGGNTLLLGSTLRTASAFGRTATVKAGEDIRPALNSLKSAGGGTLILLAGTHRPTYDIEGESSINIIGEGIGRTVVDFGGTTASIKYTNTSSVFSTLMSDFELRNFTITNSANTTGAIQILGCRDFSLEGIESIANTGNGFYVASSWYFFIQGCIADGNGANGFLITSTSSLYPNDVSNYTIINCRSDNNDSSGFALQAIGASFNSSWSIISCHAGGNGDDGFSAEDTLGAVLYGAIFGCSSSSSTNYHFDINGPNINITACTNTNGVNAFRFGSYASGTVIGCTGERYSINANSNVSITGAFTNVTNSSNQPAVSLPTKDTNSTVVGTMGGSTTTERVVLQMFNTSGSSITSGSVVVFKSASDGDEVTTTTTQGDDYVFGMMLVTSTSSTSVQRSVVTEGLTSILKVNGTTAISVGDFLGTYTTAGIAMKAAAGDMAFAIALEAYSTADSNGVIDALIVKPRKL